MATGAGLLVAAAMTSIAGASTSPGPVSGCSATAHVGSQRDNGAGAWTAPPGCSSNTSPPASSDVQVTEASNQVTVDLLVGQTLAVSLGKAFLTPAVNGSAIEQISAGGGYPSERPLNVMYRAVEPGSVDITTHTDYRCRHAKPACTRPTTLWTVHVTVTSAPPSSQVVTVSAADNGSTVTLKERRWLGRPTGSGVSFWAGLSWPGTGGEALISCPPRRPRNL